MQPQQVQVTDFAAGPEQIGGLRVACGGTDAFFHRITAAVIEAIVDIDMR